MQVLTVMELSQVRHFEAERAPQDAHWRWRSHQRYVWATVKLTAKHVTDSMALSLFSSSLFQC